MSKDKQGSSPDFDEATAKLNEGLKTCRAVVRNYRRILADDDGTVRHEPAEVSDTTEDV